jgi:Domain of unknown function (DUF4350)
VTVAGAGRRIDTSWFWLAGALTIIVIVRIVAAAGSSSSTQFSVENTRPDGTKAFYLWLSRIGYRVVQESSPSDNAWGLSPRGSTLIVMSANATLSTAQTEGIAGWVTQGGRLVVATEGRVGADLLGRLGLSVVPSVGSDVRVAQPVLLAPPVRVVSGTAAAVTNDQPAESTALAAFDGSVLTGTDVGRGHVWLLTEPHLLDNEHLALADNRRVGLNLVGPPGTTVVFDEASASNAAAPASGASTDWLTTTVWGVFLLFGFGVLATYRWLSGWRLGPAVVPILDLHRPQTEYVESLGRLLRRARKRSEILQTYQRSLQRTVNERFGKDGLDELGRGGPPLGTTPYRAAPYRASPYLGDSAGLTEKIQELLSTPTSLSEEDLLRLAIRSVECEDDLKQHHGWNPKN